MRRIVLFVLINFFYGVLLFSQDSIPAFPGAEGYGKYTSGGRGGRVIEVTNLNDSGTGSFRAAVTDAGTDPITIVFRVSGIITLESVLKVPRSNITIAGQTAPGDGICFRNYRIYFSGSNVIIRYLRFRIGDLVTTTSMTGLDTENMHYFVIDHCSMSWSMEENHTCYDNKYTTVQWCILSEGLYSSYNSKGVRSYGAQWGGQFASFHHNLFAHNNSRSPRINGSRSHDTIAMCDYRNNVIYNWGTKNAVYGGEITCTATNAVSQVNLVNNYYKPGPATSTTHRFVSPSYTAGYGYSKWYINGNYMVGETTLNTDNWNGVDLSYVSAKTNIYSSTEFTMGAVTTETAAAAYTSVLAGAGAIYPKRDSVDLRIINEVTNGTATFSGVYGTCKGIIDTQDTTGGWPTYSSATALTDTDVDGMPDDYETSVGLNPNDVTDGATITSSGYSNLEIYLNSSYCIVTKVKTSSNNDAGLKIGTTEAGFLVQAAKNIEKIQVYTINGVLVKDVNKINNNSYLINTSNLGNGIYIAKITLSDGQYFSRKILVN